jgi:APA family basic amino acid/polyamine antiporter
MASAPVAITDKSTGLVRGLGLLDSTMLVAGSMIGSGIFIVSAQIARQVGSPGWLLVVWLVTGILTVTAALSYGELAAMMPKAGGQYVYLREAFSPLWGFLYGWTLFLVIQTGTIAAVGVGFAKFLNIFWPAVSESNYLVEPVRLGGSDYALSLSTAQLVGVLMIALLTWLNTLGLRLGKWVQNTFTVTKTAALIGLILLGLLVGWNTAAVSDNFSNFWAVRPSSLLEGVGPKVTAVDRLVGWFVQIPPNFMADAGPMLTAVSTFGLFVGICVAQTNSLFSADAWNNITFTAGEVRNPQRDVPLSLALGTGLVITLYLLANIAYLVSLPFEAIQTAPADRVGSAAAQVIFPRFGAELMAGAILISTFGCNNGLILAGARALYAMARDGLFFRAAARLNRWHVPAWALLVQGIWSAFLVLPRTIKGVEPQTGRLLTGPLYNDLLTYVISAALIFYILTIAGIFRLRRTRPDAPRPYRAFGYPVVPALYIVGAAVILAVLAIYQPQATWPGLVIVATGFPVYYLWRQFGTPTTALEPLAKAP